MVRFGEYLVSHGALGEPELEETRRSQNVYGGRIGTNLIDLGFTVMSELAAHLSDYHEVPAAHRPSGVEAPDQEGRRPHPHASDPPLQGRCPCASSSAAIHIAMVDPKDPEQLEFLELAGRPKCRPLRIARRRGSSTGSKFISASIDNPRLINLGGTSTSDWIRGVRQRISAVSRRSSRSSRRAALPPLARPSAPDSRDRQSDGEEPTARAPSPLLRPPSLASVPESAREESESRRDSAARRARDRCPRTPNTGSSPRRRPSDTAMPLSGSQAPVARCDVLEAQLASASDRDEIIRIGLEIAEQLRECHRPLLGPRAGVISRAIEPTAKAWTSGSWASSSPRKP